MEIFFPHDQPRKIQESFMQQVYSSIKNKGQLLIHAPTGIGKSAAALAPAVTYILKEDPSKTIFFLTSRNTQHLIAVNTLKALKTKHNLDFTVVDLIGKKGMCNQSGVQLLTSGEFSEYCKDLREKDQCEYYSNLKIKNKLSPKATDVLTKLKHESPMHVEDINNTCFNSDLCSYEMACLLAKDAQVIIADYNYMLNSHIRTTLLNKINKELKDCIIIFDEGHNVPQRARDLLSSNLNNFILEYAAKETYNFGYKEMANDLNKMKDALEKLTKTKIPIDKQESLITKHEFYTLMGNIGNYEEMTGNFNFVADEILEQKRKSFTQTISKFMENWLGPEEGFARIFSKEFSKGGKVKINLSYKCLDPSLVLRDLTEEAHSIILMSGTLTPIDMYQDLLGLKNAVKIEYENPFPPENRLNIILPETSTKFQTRSNTMYTKIAEKCSDITNTVPGNSVIFFPSYHLRDQIYEHLRARSEKTMFLEETELSKQQRSDLLDRFKTYKDDGAVLLAVAGGSFAEGIDLPGDLLKAVIVVGLPLGKPDLETKELINYYDKRFAKGWDYGYVFPAIIKILQSAGRCIRSETDRGIVVFMDERYVWQSYRKCFPNDLKVQVNRNPTSELISFFKQNI
ncbi:MAG: ATP-dependent DNA helicase [Nanoarchaeota archaeon]|nr:ATP-dependent DNA helicase [Nanoarchaeota archaeon]